MKPKGGPAWQEQLGEFFSRITRTQALTFITGAFLLATLLTGLIFIQGPWTGQRQRLSATYSEELQRSELLMQIGSASKQLKALEQDLLIQGDTPALTSQITRLATNYGLDIESVVPRDEVLLDPYRKLQIEVVATASFRNLLLFLDATESHRPLLMVEELEMGQPIDGGSRSTIGTAPAEELKVPEPEEWVRQRIRIVVASLAPKEIKR